MEPWEYNSGNEEYKDVKTWAGLKYFIKRDFERINGEIRFSSFVKAMLFEPGFKFVFWLRVTRFLWQQRNPLLKIPFVISRMVMKHYAYKFGFDISYRCQIGPGFAIGHWGTIIIQAATVIGSNCFVRPGVVMGRKDFTSDQGYQIIGDNVELGAGSKLIGALTIGNNVTIGANAVVTKDVPDNATAVGVPARILDPRQEQ